MSPNKTTLLLVFLVFILTVAVVTLSVLYTQSDKCGPPCSPGDQGVVLHTPAATTQTKESSKNEEEEEQDDGHHPWKSSRLPASVRPSTYDLFLQVDLNEAKFNGNVTIVVVVLEDTDFFIVHSQVKLNVTNATVIKNFPSKSEEVKVRKIFAYSKRDYLVLELEETAKNDADGNYTLHFEFQRPLTTAGYGLYRDSYTDSKTGKLRFFGATKFQPIYARNVFPCFDEPSFKSRFKIHLRHDQNLYALSNMPVEKTICCTSGWMETIFTTSPLMVTYLVAFLISDFHYLSTTTIGDNKEFRVYTRPDQIQYGQFALEFGKSVHKVYEDYFDIPYALPKQDMVAIPNYIDMGMENWGLIMYNENHLLFDEQQASTENFNSIATIIAHEITHQWFGNLVTMKWWDDLWLNEGFATYFSYYGVNRVKPEWELKGSSIWTTISSLPFDDIATSHPIVQPVKSADEIGLLFDAISYHKGAAIIRMMEGFLRPETFRKGIQNFLRKYAFDSATTKDLWNELSEASNINISEIMDTWILQKGFPLIDIHRNGNNFTISQRPFLHNSSFVCNRSESPFGYLWKVPLTFRSETMINPDLVWLNMTETVTLTIPDIDYQWLKFNHDATGYYQVNYDVKQWEKFINILLRKPTSFSIEDRTGLLNDAFSLAEVNLISFDIPLKMLSYLRREKAYEPWVIVLGYLKKLELLLKETEDYVLFRNKTLDIMTPVSQRLGWEDTGSISDKKLRTALMDFMCSVQHPECVKKLTSMFEGWLNRKKFLVKPNFSTLTLVYGIANGGVKEWEEMWSRYLREISSHKKRNMLRALTSTRIPWLIRRLLDVATTNETLVQIQDVYFVLKFLSENPVGRSVLWDYVRNYRMDPYRFTRGLTNSSLGHVYEMITQSFVSHIHLVEMKHFFDLFSEEEFSNRYKMRALKQVERNIEWLQMHYEQIHNWLIN